ncbi:TPM domain-containing protein [Marinobacter orientalis]|uniref:Methanol dehydrogenase n=1 Tax=Marinobacter orientalis TaxID=1928859 RepID=A0A7Y0RDZ1_9GAMM|nr:TPM domain-containing protein [Marinobacter orientalis]NMT64491.1 methanol dehydrogenase [Marinobacter orientalis]TGX51998.1 methanol dehydrogenase [Marinobacter orientalis]
MLRRITVLLALGLIFQATAVAQSTPEFPELTGRVVDQADMLPQQVEANLSEMLKAHEQSTTEQVVVVTLPDLQGYAIEDYGYQLGRHWGIGQEGEDNGALLIVAEDERQIRIEVGYGLEGRLTDAASSTIINQIITPAFRQGDFASGIANGAAAMVQVLGGEPLAVPASEGSRAEEGKPHPALGILFFIIILLAFFGSGRRGRSAILAGALLGGLGGGRGGGLGGGGFGGGGGGFGGGGASGGW